jgi:hypothetical protein
MDFKQNRKSFEPIPKQRRRQTKRKDSYTAIYWKPKSGKHVVRIVPSKFDKDYPFREVFFHYDLTKAPILALSNFGEKDPVMEFATALRKAGEVDSLKIAKKLYPKMRVFAPVGCTW